MPEITQIGWKILTMIVSIPSDSCQLSPARDWGNGGKAIY